MVWRHRYDIATCFKSHKDFWAHQGVPAQRKLFREHQLSLHTVSFCHHQGVSMPIPVIGLHNEDKVFVNGSCVLNEERFMLIGSFVAFFIPLVIMVVTYCLTIQVAASLFLAFFQCNTCKHLCLLSSCLYSVFPSGAPEAGHCLPVWGKGFLPAAFARTSNDKHVTASKHHLPHSSDKHNRSFRCTR